MAALCSPSARSATRRWAGSAGPARTSLASRSKPELKPPTTRSTTRWICSPSTRMASSSGSTCPSPTRRVTEKRGEIYTSLGKTLSPTLRIDGGVNYEFSTLKVTGDADAERTLKFLKPNITLDWKPGAGWHTQLSIRRTVSQLNFYDFISVGDLSAHRLTGSNADLEPQRDWEFHGDRRTSNARRWPVQARLWLRSRQHARGPDPDRRRSRQYVQRTWQPWNRQALLRLR